MDGAIAGTGVSLALVISRCADIIKRAEAWLLATLPALEHNRSEITIMPNPLDKPRNAKGQFQLKHGHSYTGLNSLLYQIWISMRSRCNWPEHPAYKYYGARGIKCSSEWDSFEKFFEDMSPAWKRGLTLERKDTNGPYSKENCIWETRRAQANNRRNNCRIEFNGLNLTVSQWALRFGMPRHLIYQRFKRGWIPEQIFKPL